VPPDPNSVSVLDKLEKAMLAMRVGGMLGSVVNPPVRFQPPSAPPAPIGGGGGFRSVSSDQLQALNNLIAQRRQQQLGRFIT
jgi:hypothetical protein